jgi:hypothetical protein
MRAMVLLAGIAMAWSFVLTWVAFPFAGPDLSPRSALADGSLDPTSLQWQTLVFLGSFAAAAIAAFLALTGRRFGAMALLAGAAPVGLAIDTHFRLQDLQIDLGLPFLLDLTEPQLVLDFVDDFLRVGFWAYAVGALVLLIAGLSAVMAGSGARRH